MGGQRFELVSRCSNCYGDSPKACRREKPQSMTKCSSEYQSAYREWPWHPRLQSLKPGAGEDRISNTHPDQPRSVMERRTTYGTDYVCNTVSAKKMSTRKPKKNSAQQGMDEMAAPRLKIKDMQMENGQVIQPTRNQPFNSDTNYVYSYKLYNNDTMAECKQPPIKAKDNIEVPATGDATGNTKSTAQEDFIRHEHVDRPQPIRPIENCRRPTDPIAVRTEYKDFYTSKSIKDAQMSPARKKITTINISNDAKSTHKFDAITTVMADFVTPKNSERPSACIPPVSDHHFSKDKFETATTFHRAFKPWPVKRYETPIWAKKPTYKRPEGGMITNSLYMHDFRNPDMINPPSPIRPQDKNKYAVINRDVEDINLEKQTTYNADFRVWEDGHPRESYRIIDVYAPPKEKMVCETNQKSHYKGERADRVTPCRHVSQHRELNTDMGMTFGTTYNENFQNPHPHSAMAGRSQSANPATTTKAQTIIVEAGNIPTPAFISAAPPNSKASSGANVNILKLDKCENCKEECTCSTA